MRRHRIIFLAAITCASGCHSSKRDIQAAKHSLYDTEFTIIYNAALEAVRKQYPNLQDAPGRGIIKTAWHQVTYGNHQDDLTNPQTLAHAQGLNPGSVTSTQARVGVPTRLAYKRFFIRFDVSITGGRPWRLKVVGHASEWEPGAAMPTELHGLARPSWLEGRTNSLLASIHKRVKVYAVPMPETTEEDPREREAVPRSDPGAFKDVPAAAGKELAALKDALAGRNYTALRAELADDVVWSLGGGTGADAAMATWQADPEPLDAMTKALAAGCGGDAKRVTCPAGPPTSGAYQLVLEPRGDAWRVTSFVRAE